MDFDFSTAEKVEMHFHQELELLYLLNGRLEVQVENEIYTLNKDDFLLINSNKKHLFKAKTKEVFYAQFKIHYGELAEHLGANQLLFWCNTINDKNEKYHNLREILNEILNCYYEKQQEGSFHLESLCYEALYILTSYFMVKVDDTKLKKRQHDNRISEIQNYVQMNYHKEISLNDLAKQLYLSNAYLSKYIKKQFGMGFAEYLSNVRLFHAVDDLLYTEKKIVNVALDNGFPNTASFNKVFREYYQMTPYTYRINSKKELTKDEKEEIETEKIQQKIKEYLYEKKSLKENLIPDNKWEISVDTKFHTKIKRPWEKVVNISDMAMLLNADVREQLLIIKEELHFSHVRIWNIFVPSMYNEKGELGKQYNFGKLDRILDFLIENNLRPFIELGFKPMQLIYSAEDILLQDENEIIFHSLDSYKKALKELALHLVKRYGVEELENWYFELWHDPRIHIEEENSWYFENFEVGYKIFKEISPKIKVGGAGFALGYETHILKKAIKLWKRCTIIPDFLSVYAYSYIIQEQDGELFAKKSLDSKFIENQLAIIKKYLKEVGFKIPNIYITEWNFSISNRNKLNDSCAQGALIMKDCIAAEGEIDLLAYWHATDLYSEYYDSKGILSGDSGLITKDGIKKPSFYAFSFMSKLKDYLLGKNEYGIITSNGNHTYRIACHNSKKFTYRYVLKKENEIEIEELDSLFENNHLISLRFKINNVKNGNYLLKTYYINPENGSVQDIWKELEFSKNLMAEEIDYLKRASMPHVEMKMIQVENEILEIESILMAHEIRFIDIKYQY